MYPTKPGTGGSVDLDLIHHHQVSELSRIRERMDLGDGTLKKLCRPSGPCVPAKEKKKEKASEA